MRVEADSDHGARSPSPRSAKDRAPAERSPTTATGHVPPPTSYSPSNAARATGRSGPSWWVHRTDNDPYDLRNLDGTPLSWEKYQFVKNELQHMGLAQHGAEAR